MVILNGSVSNLTICFLNNIYNKSKIEDIRQIQQTEVTNSDFFP